MYSTKRRLEVVDPDLCVGCMSCMFACSRRFGDAGLNYSAIRIRSVGGVERGFTVVVCRACDTPSCIKVCPTSALKLRRGGGVTLDVRLCIGCGYCVGACPFGAIFWDEVSDKPLICTHCGYCVEFCPYGVIRVM